MPPQPARVLILTPMKSASRYLDGYFDALERLSYPAALLSLGILEGDSQDDTSAQLERRLAGACRGFARKRLFRKDFGFSLPANVPRHSPAYQIQRRTVLARARNHLLFSALQDEDWVLWLDVDVVEYPNDILQTLIAIGPLDPLADRPGGAAELPGELIKPPSRAVQLDHLAPELRCVSLGSLGHLESLAL